MVEGQALDEVNSSGTPGDAKPSAQAGPDEAANLARVNERLSASSLRIAVVPLDQCDLADRNARFMKAEQYRRLVHNIRRDGCLTSVPFAVRHAASTASPERDRYTILSGNHRVKAARDAGLKEILVLYSEQELSHQEQVAIQLSHNAVVGQDDLAILRELYDEINEVALKEYSGIDDVVLGRMSPPELDPLSESQLEYRIVSIAFLPDEVKRAEQLFDKILQECLGETTWVNRHAEYDRLLDALTVAKQRAGVKNTATAFGLLLDVAEKHLEEIVSARPESSSGRSH